MSRPLRLGYKGGRSYLHGSDIFHALNEWALECQGGTAYVARLSFRQLARTSCAVSTEPPKAGLMGEGLLNVSGVEVPFWVVETGGAVQRRYAYDEEKVVAPLILDIAARQAVLPIETATPIEEIIAVTKRLNNEVAPLVDGKWLFGQLQLNGPLLRGGGDLKIVMRSLLASRFSINEIYYGNRLVGNIRFVVGHP